MMSTDFAIDPEQPAEIDYSNWTSLSSDEGFGLFPVLPDMGMLEDEMDFGRAQDVLDRLWASSMGTTGISPGM
jgi:hypothetical protein